jgi:hypothetical protein
VEDEQLSVLLSASCDLKGRDGAFVALAVTTAFVHLCCEFGRRERPFGRSEDRTELLMQRGTRPFGAWWSAALGGPGARRVERRWRSVFTGCAGSGDCSRRRGSSRTGGIAVPPDRPTGYGLPTRSRPAFELDSRLTHTGRTRFPWGFALRPLLRSRRDAGDSARQCLGRTRGPQHEGRSLSRA